MFDDDSLNKKRMFVVRGSELFDALFFRFSARMNESMNQSINESINRTTSRHHFGLIYFHFAFSFRHPSQKGLSLKQIGNDHEAAIGISRIALGSFGLLLSLEHIILLLLSIIHIIEPQTAENKTEL